MPKRHFTKKLRNRMLLMIGGTLAIILALLSMASWYMTRKMMVRELTGKSRVKVRIAARKINAWVQKRGDLLRMVAQREELQWTTREFKQDFFAALMARHKVDGISTIYMGLEDGGYATGTYRIPPPQYVARERPWYRAARRARGVVFTKPYVDWVTGKAVLTVAAPVYRKGRLLGVIAMDTFMDQVVQTVEELRIGEESFAYVVDETGLFMTHPASASVGRQNIALTHDHQLFKKFKQGGAQMARGDAVLYVDRDYSVLASIPVTRWIVMFHLPFSEVNRPLNRLTLILFLLIALTLMVVTVTIILISVHITGPVIRLAKEAGRVAEGDYEIEMAVTSRDELGYVANCFNDMTDGLRDREFIRSTFGRYVSKDVMNDILAGNIELGGEKMELTVLFSDIRGFTSISESMDPMALVSLLNAYFDRMDRAISEAGGTINKYMGDGILAIFGAPQSLPNSAEAAVTAALNKQRYLASFNAERGTDLAIGVGIHTGPAVVGNIGSMERTEYTVIGDTVNLGSRVESLTKLYGEPILITDGCAAHLSHERYCVKTVDRVRVKGKATPVTLAAPFERKRMTATEIERVERVNGLMEHYFAGEFARCRTILQQLEPLDTHLTLVARRIRDFCMAPPADWDGVSTMTKK